MRSDKTCNLELTLTWRGKKSICHARNHALPSGQCIMSMSRIWRTVSVEKLTRLCCRPMVKICLFSRHSLVKGCPLMDDSKLNDLAFFSQRTVLEESRKPRRPSLDAVCLRPSECANTGAVTPTVTRRYILWQSKLQDGGRYVPLSRFSARRD